MKIIKATLTNEDGRHQAFVAVLVNGAQHVASGHGATPEGAIYGALQAVAERLVLAAIATVTVKTVATIA
jgi:hypothetical protein